MWPFWTACGVRMRRGGVGPRRLKRTKRGSRREILSVDRPCSPRACGMSQWQRIAQSRVKPLSVRSLGLRVSSSIPRTFRMRLKAEGGCLLLFYSKALACQIRAQDKTDPNTGLHSLVGRVSGPNEKTEDAGVSKILPPPVLFAPRRCCIGTDSIDTPCRPPPSTSKTP